MGNVLNGVRLLLRSGRLRRAVRLLALACLVFPHTANAQTPAAPKPDYRKGTNLPVYDPSLFPLGKLKTKTGVWTELNPNVPRHYGCRLFRYTGVYNHWHKELRPEI